MIANENYIGRGTVKKEASRVIKRRENELPLCGMTGLYRVRSPLLHAGTCATITKEQLYRAWEATQSSLVKPIRYGSSRPDARNG